MRDVLDREITLVLTRHWLPLGYTTVKRAIKALFPHNNETNAAKAIDIGFNLTEDGEVDFYSPSYFNDIEWAEWFKLEVRDFDEVIHLTNNRVIRAPTVIISNNHEKLPCRTLKPTKRNVFRKYNNRCIYTNKILPNHRLTLEHVVPLSKGGRKFCWTNLAPADKYINNKKGSLSVEEAGLKLQYKLTPPPATNHLLISEPKHPTWIPFLIRK